MSSLAKCSGVKYEACCTLLRGVLTVFIVMYISGIAHPQDRVVASYRGGKITESELKKHLEFSPSVEDFAFGKDSMKLQVLSSMIAERLWAQEAAELGYETNPQLTGYLDLLKKMFVRDALFKKEIEKNIVITSSDWAQAEWKKDKALSVLIISERDSQKIAGRYNQVKTNPQLFDTICFAQKGQGAKSVNVIHFGDLTNESIETYLYAMTPGQISIPLFDGINWHIFKLLREDPYKPPAKDPLNTWKNRFKERRTKDFGEKYLDSLLRSVKIQYDNAEFSNLSKNLEDVLQAKRVGKPADSTLYITERDCNDLMQKLSGEQLSKPVILFPENPLTVKNVLDYISFHGLSVQPEKIPYFAAILARELKKLTQEELLYREGSKQYLDYDETVLSDLREWKDNALAQVIRNRYMDSVSVSEEQVNQFYQDMNRSQEAAAKIKMSVMAFPVFSDMVQVLDSLYAGQPFEKYEDKHRQNLFNTTSPMPLAYFTRLGIGLETRKAGDIVGPAKIDSLYYIGKVVQKKEADSLFLKPFSQVKNELTIAYKAKLLHNTYKQKTAGLAKKYDVRVDPNVLSTIKYTTVPTFVYRFIGFGGQISAVPYVTPMYEWMKDYKKQQQQVP
jgi:peptidyl-prolyl cis-trans isomerase C